MKTSNYLSSRPACIEVSSNPNPAPLIKPNPTAFNNE
jgi:hypothetical protein